jgi:hypothetical protein
MKPILKPSLVAVLLLAALFACAKKHTEGAGLRSLGNIAVNGPGFDGSVHADAKVLYTLNGILANQNYTLRTEIGLLSDSLKSDGTLTALIYASADDFRNNPDAVVASAAPAVNNPNIYEVNFTAQSSGDYVVVISGVNSVLNVQFFYNLRLMSADPNADPTVLTRFTVTTVPALDEHLSSPLNPGALNIYSGGTVTPSGDHSITLVSNATTTIANPQIFVYRDSTLTVSSLMLSSIPTVTEIVTTSFNAGVPVTTSVTSINVNTNVISNVTFTNQADDNINHVGSPFIVLKGAVSAATYTLSIGP